MASASMVRPAQRLLPKLFLPAPPFHVAETFEVQLDLFSRCDLIVTRRSTSGRTTVSRYKVSSPDEAHSFVQKCVARRHSSYFVSKSFPLPSSVFHTNSNKPDFELALFPNKLNLRCVSAAMIKKQFAKTLTIDLFKSMAVEQNKTNVVSFVPKTLHPHLDKHLVSVFARHANLREFAYDLEDDGIRYVGDLIKFSRDDILVLSGDESKVTSIEDRLAKMGLKLDMKAPGWVSPLCRGPYRP